MEPKHRITDCTGRLFLGHSFRHVKVRSTAAVGVGHHTGNYEAKLLIKQRRMSTTEIPQVPKMSRQVNIKIRS